MRLKLTAEIGGGGESISKQNHKWQRKKNTRRKEPFPFFWLSKNVKNFSFFLIIRLLDKTLIINASIGNASLFG